MEGRWRWPGIQEVTRPSEVEVRIGYSVADGSSASSLGRDVLKVELTEPTTSLAGTLRRATEAAPPHEPGHVLGMEHKHQNPSTT